MTVRSVAEARRLEEREQRQRRLNEEKLQKIEFHVNGMKRECIRVFFFFIEISENVYSLYVLIYSGRKKRFLKYNLFPAYRVAFGWHTPELEPEITIAASTLNSCLELLIPTPEEFSIPAAEEDDGPSNGTAKKKKKRTDRVIGSDDEGKNAGGNGQEETGVTVELRPGNVIFQIYIYNYGSRRLLLFATIEKTPPRSVFGVVVFVTITTYHPTAQGATYRHVRVY